MSKFPFTVAIVGRPNVGKSTLFNRLAGKRIALVDDTPGVTRDRRAGEGKLADLYFKLIDTAGFEEGEAGSLSARMRTQTESALEEADVALMLYDARAGVTPLDEHFADVLRRGSTPVVLVANKCESQAQINGIYESYALGLGDPLGLSAEHGEGLAELYTAIVEALKAQDIDPYAEEDEEDADTGPDRDAGPEEGDLEYEFEDTELEEEDERPLRMAIVGRPNAGKSTLINEMLGEDRVITGPEAGLTRDSISVDWEWDGLPVTLWDTAGLRRKSRIDEKLEKLSVSDTLRAIQFAEICVLMIDSERGLDKQDVKIAEHVVNEGRALVVALNKWDIVEDRLGFQRNVRDVLSRALSQLKGVEIVTLSALTGAGLHKLMPAVESAMGLWNARIPTSVLNRWLEEVTDRHPAPSVQGRRIKIRYGAQIKTRPPTFRLFCNRPEDLPDSYVRYLENQLRDDFELPGVPLRILMKKSENPYGSRRKTKKQRSKK